MSKKTMIGLSIATAAALAFASIPATSAFADESTASVKCVGANSCKGHSACKTANNSCKGHNSCKGQGMTMMDSEKACLDAGGKVG